MSTITNYKIFVTFNQKKKRRQINYDKMDYPDKTDILIKIVNKLDILKKNEYPDKTTKGYPDKNYLDKI